MKKNLIEIIHQIIANQKEIVDTHILYKKDMLQKKYSSAQKNLIYEKYLKKKNFDLTQRIKSSIDGCILDIRYLANNKEYKAKLTNMTEEEVRALFELYGYVDKIDIEILEIKKSTTFISEPLL